MNIWYRNALLQGTHAFSIIIGIYTFISIAHDEGFIITGGMIYHMVIYHFCIVSRLLLIIIIFATMAISG